MNRRRFLSLALVPLVPTGSAAVSVGIDAGAVSGDVAVVMLLEKFRSLYYATYDKRNGLVWHPKKLVKGERCELSIA